MIFFFIVSTFIFMFINFSIARNLVDISKYLEEIKDKLEKE